MMKESLTIMKMKVKDKIMVNQFLSFLKEYNLKIKFVKVLKKKKKYMYLKSPHVNSKSKEQFFLSEYLLVYISQHNLKFIMILIKNFSGMFLNVKKMEVFH